MKHLSGLLPAFALVCLAALCSCAKEPKVITNTIVETDTLYLVQQDTIFITTTDTLSLTEYVQDTATTFILVRHAETTGAGSDPALSASGQARADELRRILSNVPLSAVYASNFNRTMQTAQPVAQEKSLPVSTYDPLSPGPFADAALATYHAGTVLVVGHSNTVPALLNVLTGTNAWSNLPDTEYDNLFLVTVLEKGRATVVHMKYGE
ncbi:MAG: histidine phosphatase family protein [Saprospiraceae bacterium]|nr:histidine phosphatase family protein [Saprospiraceae bacterium]